MRLSFTLLSLTILATFAHETCQAMHSESHKGAKRAPSRLDKSKECLSTAASQGYKGAKSVYVKAADFYDVASHKVGGACTSCKNNVSSKLPERCTDCSSKASENFTKYSDCTAAKSKIDGLIPAALKENASLQALIKDHYIVIASIATMSTFFAQLIGLFDVSLIDFLFDYKYIFLSCIPGFVHVIGKHVSNDDVRNARCDDCSDSEEDKADFMLDTFYPFMYGTGLGYVAWFNILQWGAFLLSPFSSSEIEIDAPLVTTDEPENLIQYDSPPEEDKIINENVEDLQAEKAVDGEIINENVDDEEVKVEILDKDITEIIKSDIVSEKREGDAIVKEEIDFSDRRRKTSGLGSDVSALTLSSAAAFFASVASILLL